MTIGSGSHRGIFNCNMPGSPYRLMWLPCLIVTADLALIGLDFFSNLFDMLGDWKFRVSNDWSYGEIFQYFKELAIGLGFLFLYWQRRFGIYVIWAALFFFFLLDDALSIHENGGAIIRRALEFRPYFGLRAQDFGELAVIAPIGFVFLAGLIFAYGRANQEARSLSRIVFVLIGALLVFGVFGDLLHSWIQRRKDWFAIFEDGGEMFAMSGVASIVYLKLINAPWRRWIRNPI